MSRLPSTAKAGKSVTKTVSAAIVLVNIPAYAREPKTFRIQADTFERSLYRCSGTYGIDIYNLIHESRRTFVRSPARLGDGPVGEKLVRFVQSVNARYVQRGNVIAITTRKLESAFLLNLFTVWEKITADDHRTDHENQPLSRACSGYACAPFPPHSQDLRPGKF